MTAANANLYLQLMGAADPASQLFHRPGLPSLTYGDLADRSAQMAVALQSTGAVAVIDWLFRSTSPPTPLRYGLGACVSG